MDQEILNLFLSPQLQESETEASQENSANVDIYFYTCASPTFDVSIKGPLSFMSL